MKILMRSLVISIFIIFLLPQISQPCTTFFFNHDGQPVFGKSYDMFIEHGLVIINKRGVLKVAMGMKNFDTLASWTSKYGSLTFNQYGRESPMGGINESGLVVEIMALTDSVYPPKDDRPVISAMQWIQYQLDNFSKVEQVIASNSQIRIYDPMTGRGKHFLVADKEGNSATIEFIDGKMIYHTQETLAVKALTNNTYDESIEYMKNFKEFGENKSISDSANSLDRFVRAANLLKNFDSGIQTSSIEYAFNILSNVSNSFSAWPTQWSIVYDIQKLRVYFRTLSNKQIRYIDLHSFDFSCQSPVKIMNINFAGSGAMTGNFTNYTQKVNLDLIRQSYIKTYSRTFITDEYLEQLSKYPESFSCDQQK
jgi:penicillin V acylase-like amidase (Ntn superfamily)